MLVESFNKRLLFKPFAFLEGSFLHNDNLSLAEVLSPGHLFFVLFRATVQEYNGTKIDSSKY